MELNTTDGDGGELIEVKGGDHSRLDLLVKPQGLPNDLHTRKIQKRIVEAKQVEM